MVFSSGSSHNLIGDVHKRHRRALAPAFGRVESQGLLPDFMDTANKACELRWYLISRADSGPRLQMADKWSNIIENSRSGCSVTIDVNMWLGKATLDACVLVWALSVCGLQTNREPISEQDWCWGFRVRLRGLRRGGQPVCQILYEHSVRLLHAPLSWSSVLFALIVCCSLVPYPWGTPLVCSFSLCLSWDGSQDSPHG